GPLDGARDLHPSEVNALSISGEHLEADRTLALAVRREAAHVARATELAVARLVVLDLHLPCHDGSPSSSVRQSYTSDAPTDKPGRHLWRHSEVTSDSDG